VPGAYGNTPESFLFANNKGVFENVTQSAAPGLSTFGMVTDAAWFDADNDGLTDLAIVGEWMPLTILKNDGRKLSISSLIINSGIRLGGGTVLRQRI
jgi:hypothetical protein